MSTQEYTDKTRTLCVKTKNSHDRKKEQVDALLKSLSFMDVWFGPPVRVTF